MYFKWPFPLLIKKEHYREKGSRVFFKENCAHVHVQAVMVYIFSFLAFMTFRIAFRLYLEVCQIRDPKFGASKRAKYKNSCLTTHSCPGIGFLLRLRTGSNQGGFLDPKSGPFRVPNSGPFVTKCKREGSVFGARIRPQFRGRKLHPVSEKMGPKTEPDGQWVVSPGFLN